MKPRTLSLAYGTLGIIFGGFATSPLYTYSAINLPNATEDDLLCVYSIIFWSLTLVGLIKHALILLEADDNGEGGTFALYSLLCKHANISRCHLPIRSNKTEPGTTGSCSAQQYVVHLLEQSRTAKCILFALTMLGSCMLIGDGVLTPAISVLSAMSGLRNVLSLISQSVVVAITTILLVALFLVQRFGTERVSSFFSPVMVTWLVTTPLIGAYNIAVFYPKIYKAISPQYIFTFFIRNGKDGWLALGGTLLCISGAEAMFADLGHFDKRSIQVAFLFGVYPSNLITYAGQTAYFIKHPHHLSQGFYSFVPSCLFWPMFIISTLAAIVASEGLVSGCFSLIKQSVEMDQFPRVSLIHTSRTQEGQVYSPEVNYFLMVLCAIVVVGFGDEAALGNAFGVTVITVMFITTLLFALVMLVVWGTPLPLVLAFAGSFTVIEGAYFAAALSKVPRGGWLPFLVATILAGIMFTWIYGRQKKHDYEMSNRISLDAFDSLLATADIKRVTGLCIFYSHLVDEVPPVMNHYLRNVRSLHEIIVITNVRKARVPTITETERFEFCRGGLKGIFRCKAQIGYAEPIDTDEWSKLSPKLVQSFKEYIDSAAAERGKDETESGEICDGQKKQLVTPSGKNETPPVFVVGRTQLVAKRGRNFLRRLVIERMYGFLHTNCRSAKSMFGIPPPSFVEIGMLYEV